MKIERYQCDQCGRVIEDKKAVRFVTVRRAGCNTYHTGELCGTCANSLIMALPIKQEKS